MAGFFRKRGDAFVAETGKIEESRYVIRRAVGDSTTTYEEKNFKTNRQITTMKGISHFRVSRTTGGKEEVVHYLVHRAVRPSKAYDEAKSKTIRKLQGRQDADWLTRLSTVVTDESDWYIIRQPSFFQYSYHKTERGLGRSKNSRGRILRYVTRTDMAQQKSIRYVHVKKEQFGHVSLLLKSPDEEAVWAVNRLAVRPKEERTRTERRIRKLQEVRGKTVRYTAQAEVSQFHVDRKVRNGGVAAALVRRSIIVARERSHYTIFQKYVEPLQERFYVHRNLSNGIEYVRYKINRAMTTADEGSFKTDVSYVARDTAHRTVVRNMNKPPEEYFGKVCTYIQNVRGFTMGALTNDANIELGSEVNDKEKILDIIQTRKEKHEAFNQRGNLIQYADDKLLYYPPLNGLSTIMILPNWNTSKAMIESCKKRQMIFEAKQLEGKRYQLHIRTNIDAGKAPEKEEPLYFTIVVLNPDRTINDGGNPTIINMLTEDGISDATVEEIKKLFTGFEEDIV